MLSSYNTFWKRRPKTILVAWLFISAIFAFWGYSIELLTELPGPASTATLNKNVGEQIAREKGIPAHDNLVLILESELRTVEDAKFIAAKESLYQVLKSLKSTVNKAVFTNIRTQGHTIFEDDSYISVDKHHLLITANTTVTIDESANRLKTFPDTIDQWEKAHPDFTVHYLSAGTADNEVFEMINRDLHHSLLYTIPLTFLVLLYAFGSLVAAAIPLFFALVSLASSLGVSAILSHLFGPVSVTASQLVVLLVLAIGVDYSLFILSRVNEEFNKGVDYPSAIERARATAGVAVLWSGLTVALSLTGLLLMGDSLLTSMAFVSVLAVAITVIGSFNVVPSLLLLLGKKLYWHAWKNHFPTTNIAKQCLTFVVRRPIFSLISSLAVLVLLCYSALDLQLGNTVEPRHLPTTLSTARTFEKIRSHFPDLAGTDFSIIVNSDDNLDLEESDALIELMDELLTLDTVKGPLAIQKSPDGTTIRYNFVALGSSNDENNRDIITSLRTKLIPTYLTPRRISAYVGGTLPYVYDDVVRYQSRTPLVCGTVLFVSLVFLLLAFRSLVVPLKALLLNTLSTTASFGVMVLVFQSNYFSSLNYGVIESFIPPLFFAILFGLSMDYHVFLLSRIQEEFRATNNNELAISRGILATSGTVTNAALIMVSVFAIIATLELPLMRELGIGLAFAVFLDATLIRSVLLPSSMVLLGKWNWYLPKFLGFSRWGFK
jgi:RND superfamily putative drug exporter